MSMCHLPRKIRTTPESHTPVSCTTIIRVHLNWAVGRGGPKEREARRRSARRGGGPQWEGSPNGAGGRMGVARRGEAPNPIDASEF